MPIGCLGEHTYGKRKKLYYNALVRSAFDLDVDALRKLDSVPSRAMRIITGAMKSSPIKLNVINLPFS